MVSFPHPFLYADPENKVYDALELVKSNPMQLMFDPRTPLSLAKRVATGNSGDLQTSLRTWKPWIPPKMDQGLQQGGAFVFDGYKDVLYARKDPATGDHADLNQILDIALST